jgi:eukaryotic-like serine/threonine-protein kinase
LNLSVPKAAPPTRLGRYVVRAKIAEGGMAAVYVGQLVEGGGQRPAVALKVIRDEFAKNPDFLNMFVDEERIVARLKHPNIVEIYELGMEGSRVFLAMELLFGQSLWNVWDACRERGVRLRYDMAAWMGARVAEGLHYAHESRDASGQPLEIVHRDVNATNIFVTFDGHIKIIDFGLAKAQNRVSKTASGVIKGKVAYMSPEQTVGQPIDRRTDVFALGTTLWEITVDRRLFKHTDDIETLKRVNACVVPDPTTFIPDYPPALWHVLRRALAKERTERFATCAEMARELDIIARSGGRVLTPADVAAVMNELFGQERERQAAWLADASAPDRPAPAEPLRPQSKFYAANIGVDAASLRPPPPAAQVPPLLQPPPPVVRVPDPARLAPTVRPAAPPPVKSPEAAGSTLKSAKHAPSAPSGRAAKAAVVGLLVLVAVAIGVAAAVLSSR